MLKKNLYVIYIVFVCISFGRTNNCFSQEMNGISGNFKKVNVKEVLIRIIEENSINEAFERNQTDHLLQVKAIQNLLLPFFDLSDKILILENRRESEAIVSCSFMIWPVGYEFNYFFRYKLNEPDSYSLSRSNSFKGFEILFDYADYMGEKVIEIPAKDCPNILNSYKSRETIYSFTIDKVVKPLYFGICGIE